MMTRHARFLIPFATLLSACAVPEDATVNRADLRADTADIDRARFLERTLTEQIPTGSASYHGVFQSDAIVNGQEDYIVSGDLALAVDFQNDIRRTDNDVTGRISNVNLIDNANDGFDDQRLTGDLDIAGRTTNGQLDARAIGVLGAVLSDTPFTETATWDLDLDGDFRSDFENADVVTGRVLGGTTGDNTNDYSVRLTNTGRFIGERTD